MKRIFHTDCPGLAASILCLFLSSFTCQDRVSHTNLLMHIDLKSESGQLLLALDNPAAEPVRVWELYNSWGWSTLSFMVKTEGTAREIRLIRRENRVWTKDGPVYVEIAPHSNQRIPVNPGDKSWETDREALQNKTLFIKAVLDIPDSPEAREHGVFVGKIESDWIRFDPPHRWLFPEN